MLKTASRVLSHTANSTVSHTANSTVSHTARSVKPVPKTNMTAKRFGKERMKKTIANLTYSLGRKPTPKELAEHNRMEGGTKRRRSKTRRS